MDVPILEENFMPLTWMTGLVHENYPLVLMLAEWILALHIIDLLAPNSLIDTHGHPPKYTPATNTVRNRNSPPKITAMSMS
jgi:hypothetical protein